MLKLVHAMVSTIVLCLLSSTIFSQQNIDVGKNEFGISIGFNKSLPRIIDGGFDIAPISPYSVEGGFGFELGLLYQRLLSEKFHLRGQPLLSFTQSEFTYNANPSPDVRKREAVIIELPINLVFEDVTKKIGPSFSLGAKYGYDIAANSRARKPDPASPLTKPHQFSLDASVGLRCYFNYFTFKPELVYSRGLIANSDVPFALQNGSPDFSLDQIALRLVFYGSNKKKKKNNS